MKKNYALIQPANNRVFVLLIFLFMVSITGRSQGVAMNTTLTPANPSAGLDIDFATKGFLIPRVALTGTASFAPLGATHIAGMLVYNTATTTDLKPGLYSDDGTKWVAIMLPAGTSTGDMQYWNGTVWILIPTGQPGQKLKLIGGIPTWSSL